MVRVVCGVDVRKRSRPCDGFTASLPPRFAGREGVDRFIGTSDDRNRLVEDRNGVEPCRDGVGRGFRGVLEFIVRVVEKGITTHDGAS